MPWGTTKAQKAALKRLQEKKKSITAHAKVLHKNTIKNLSSPKKSMYSGIFFYVYLYEFCRKRDIRPILVILLLIIDFYEVFVYSQIQDWGLTETDEQVAHWLRKLRREKFTEKEQGQRAHYFLAIKGKNLLREFLTYYETRRDAQLEKNKNGHKKLVVYFSRGDILRIKQDNLAKGIEPQRTFKW